MERLRAHRREEAGQGFPLLRGCPSTFVLRRLAVLDALTMRDREAYAEELSVLAEAEAGAKVGAALSQADRGMLLARLPLVAEVHAAGPQGPDLRFQTVKTLARLAGEPGGIAGFARAQGLEGVAAGPPAPHVPSFDAAVPVPPGRLRKAVLGALGAAFGGTVRKVGAELEQMQADCPRGRIVLNLIFAGKGGGARTRQMEYSLWADLEGRRMEPTAYESLWLLPAQWDLITPGNVEAAAAHLVRVVEARLGLA